MNVSAPSSDKNLSIAPSSPTPLSTAQVLLADLRGSSASLDDFTTMLSTLTTASFLLTDLSQIQHFYLHPNITEIQQTVRYINDMTTISGASTHYERILYAATIGDAAHAMHASVVAETEKYHNNMTILLSQALKKMKTEIAETGSFHYSVRRLGKDGLDSAHALKELVGWRATAAYHEGYLSEIARFWRRWAGTAGARPYEDIWTYVSGRVLVQE